MLQLHLNQQYWPADYSSEIYPCGSDSASCSCNGHARCGSMLSRAAWPSRCCPGARCQRCYHSVCVISALLKYHIHTAFYSALNPPHPLLLPSTSHADVSSCEEHAGERPSSLCCLVTLSHGLYMLRLPNASAAAIP